MFIEGNFIKKKKSEWKKNWWTQTRKKNWTLTNEKKKKKKTEEVRSKYRLKNWIVEVTDEKTNKQKQKPYKK